MDEESKRQVLEEVKRLEVEGVIQPEADPNVRLHPKLVAIRISTELHRYIEVHNDVFGGSWIRRILPLPGIFQRTDFSSLAVELRSIRSNLDEAEDGLLNAAADADAPLRLALARYIPDLKEAVANLLAICDRLADKANGASFSRAEYAALVDAYNESVEVYRESGEAVNRAMADE